MRGFGALAIGGTVGGTVAGLPGPAAALQMLPTDDMRGALDQGCGATAYHRRLIDEAVRVAGAGLTAEERSALLARLSCPTCHCPLNLIGGPAGDGGF
ncbi:hypothetical protein DEW08_19085 [Azospirillum thermophilum]|uniref:Uncharacterized protein n=1 Tax=Azospirillum thermophilum TaxID=2202148 RepID=A0A2S2CVM2_9PROT|nr:hypothetical protein DEW08_19085 [Azospirillum thermophilum]